MKVAQFDTRVMGLVAINFTAGPAKPPHVCQTKGILPRPEIPISTFIILFIPSLTHIV